MGWVGTLLIIIGISFFVIGSGITAFILMRRHLKIPNVSESGRQVINYLPQFTKGFQMGWELPNYPKKHSSGRYITRFFEIESGKFQILQLVIGKNLRFVQNTLGKKQIVYYLPKNVHDLPNNTKGTALGKLFTDKMLEEESNRQISALILGKEKQLTTIIQHMTASELIHDLKAAMSIVKDEEDKKDHNK